MKAKFAGPFPHSKSQFQDLCHGFNCIPSEHTHIFNIYIKIQIPSILEQALIWKQAVKDMTNLAKMRSYSVLHKI